LELYSSFVLSERNGRGFSGTFESHDALHCFSRRNVILSHWNIHLIVKIRHFEHTQSFYLLFPVWNMIFTTSGFGKKLNNHEEHTFLKTISGIIEIQLQVSCRLDFLCEMEDASSEVV
jgi:hypothetical protein